MRLMPFQFNTDMHMHAHDITLGAHARNGYSTVACALSVCLSTPILALQPTR